MNLLLDTHTWIWWLTGEKLSDVAASEITDRQNVIYVSAASIWEASIKSKIGKLDVTDDLWSDDDGFEFLNITSSHAWSAGQLPLIHRDPFDRMLIAQAREQGVTLATRDTTIPRYDVATLKA